MLTVNLQKVVDDKTANEMIKFFSKQMALGIKITYFSFLKLPRLKKSPLYFHSAVFCEIIQLPKSLFYVRRRGKIAMLLLGRARETIWYNSPIMRFKVEHIFSRAQQIASKTDPPHAKEFRCHMHSINFPRQWKHPKHRSMLLMHLTSSSSTRSF
jgi:hypothetical protein